ncbi:hypothetical protein SVIOM342S_06080 [Streptomyces violaceorubidus]
MPACTYALAMGNSPVRAWACEAPISWCGKARSEPPPWTSKPMPRWSRAMATHSMCQPGRPRPRVPPSQLGSPSRAAIHSIGSSGFFLPGRSGSPPRSAESSRIAAASRWETPPKCGSASTEK